MLSYQVPFYYLETVSPPEPAAGIQPESPSESLSITLGSRVHVAPSSFSRGCLVFVPRTSSKHSYTASHLLSP